jgi:hypothetical protein
MTAAVSHAASMLTFAAKLPTQTAGQSRLPPKRSAATAMPEGGHSAVA